MDTKKKSRLGRIFLIIGPGFVTASVVIGPGSISTNSKIGAYYGYELIWVLAAAIISMVIFTVMAARFGVVSEVPILQVVANKYGRWLAVWVGISAYFMSAGFNFGNNLGLATAMQSITGISENVWPPLFCVTAAIIIFTSSDLYKVLERMMMVLVAVMIGAFAANLFFTKPDGIGVLSGFIPRLPEGSITTVAGLSGTTFCINAALYQAYLVQDKGWKVENYKKCITDSVAGVVVLGFISLMIMVTAASSLHPRGILVSTAGDMAFQLEALFGMAAKFIFCIGLLAASFSSLVISSFLGEGSCPTAWAGAEAPEISGQRFWR